MLLRGDVTSAEGLGENWRQNCAGRGWGDRKEEARVCKDSGESLDPVWVRSQSIMTGSHSQIHCGPGKEPWQFRQAVVRPYVPAQV